MVMRVVVLLLFVTNLASAKSLSRRLHVSKVRKISKSRRYTVTFKEMAAYYYADKNTAKCLAGSARDRSPVLVKWNIKTLEIEKCKK
ncbi:MAG: hypothetical protein BM556_07645 [Bacteriovorax sp. MedPE-SWde]|nr:MAG: hypothetical protein BM556_07645 [Bacteriovorax sp. MedPE-SWde]